MHLSDPIPSLLDSHIVIIGGASGIGLATAQLAKALGAEVTLVGRTRSTLERAATSVGGARVAVADIRERKAVEAVFTGLARVDHLVITAGALYFGKLSETGPDFLFQALQERVAGPLYAIKAALPLMPPGASITLTGGLLADRPAANGSAVISAAVSAVEGLARALALELQPIRVNVLAPGWIDTPLFDAFGQEAREAVLTEAAAKLPGGRVGSPEEAGQAIAFMMRSPYLNGEILHLDGAARIV